MPLTRHRRGIRLSTKNAFRLDIDSMSGGVNTLISDTRLDKNEAKELTNMWLVEDGVADKRPGTVAYGTITFTNRPDGATEYTKTDLTRELIVVADGKCYVVTTTLKTEITGATFTQGTRCYFLQYNNFLYIANGVDPLARYNGSTLSTYSGISTPAWDGTPIARTGLTSGSYNHYYQVTALNDIGETLAVAATTITTNLPRDSWDSSNYLTLGWGDVTGATKYNVYYSDTIGFEVKLDETTASTYKDDGSAVPNPYIEVPDADTTTGPKFTKMAVANNRIWATGDPQNPYRVYFSGVGVNKGNFAPGYGGGWVDLEKGSRETTVSVDDFQGVARIWTKTADGHGSIWQVKLDTVTIAETSFSVPIPDKIIGSVGCDSGRGVVKVENDLLFANKQGVYVLGNEPGIQGVLRTNELSAKIRPTWRAFDGGSLNKAATYYYQARVYFAVSNASGEPDHIALFDRERSAWIPNAFSVGVSQFLEFTDSAGATHFLGISSNKLIEFDPAYESDQGVAFTWRYTSSRMPVEKDWNKFGRVKRAYVRVRNATGNIDVSLSGTGTESQYASVGAATISPGSSNSGLGWDQFGSVEFGATSGTVNFFASESFIKYLQIVHSRNILRDVQWTISGDSVGDRCVITGLAVEGLKSNVPLNLSDEL